MSDLVRIECHKLQNLFAPFNSKGAWMSVDMIDGQKPIDFGLMDSFVPIRVLPYVDKSGDVTSVVFWLLFKSAGYNNGWQYSHTKKMVSWIQDDTYELDLVDDDGWKYHIELIFPELDPGMKKLWDDWQKYKRSRAQYFKEIDRNILRDHVDIANNWKRGRE